MWQFFFLLDVQEKHFMEIFWQSVKDIEYCSKNPFQALSLKQMVYPLPAGLLNPSRKTNQWIWKETNTLIQYHLVKH
jgi:hypothetical protein